MSFGKRADPPKAAAVTMKWRRDRSENVFISSLHPTADIVSETREIIATTFSLAKTYLEVRGLAFPACRATRFSCTTCFKDCPAY